MLACFFKGAFIADHVVGIGDFFFDGKLGCQNVGCGRLGDVVAFGQSFDLGLFGHVDHHQFVHHILQVDFNHQWYHHLDDGPWLFSGYLLDLSGKFHGDLGMNKAFQLFTFDHIVENNIRQFLAIQGAVFLQDLFPKERDDLFPCLFVRFHHIP